MTRQDKATSEKHARILRELVKRPENKTCADCKRNDPRWASWNLGVFLCIRCSGIHRGMGTHISKIKSIDLDVWTPEQMESIEKWGNRLANLYWEAHLKPGHMPQEHKMESFIRSKYETRRWAMEGPPPQDPSVLEQGSSTATDSKSTPVPNKTASPRPSHATTGSISSSKPAPPVVTRPPQAHQLLSANFVGATQTAQSVPASAPAQEAKPAAPTNNELFSLDFHAPAAPAQTSDILSSAQPKKDVKENILSLFSTQSSAVAASTAAPLYNAFSSQPAAASPWASNATANHQTQPTSMIGTTGVGAWGASSGWTGGSAAPSSQSSLWGTPGTAATQSSLFNTSEVWGVPQNQASQVGNHQQRMTSVAPTVKKDDVFDDIWGGFK